MNDAAQRIIAEIDARKARDKRLVVAIAGAPGSGKSTLAEVLCSALNAREAETAAILPMDGFHLDNAVLDARGLRPRKGAPETFDADGLAATLERLAQSDRPVAVPVFDRSRDIAVAGARVIDAATPVVIVEGNYLLLDTPPWAQLRRHFGLTVMVETETAELERRLKQRWRDHGIDPAEAERRITDNDMVNAALVVRSSVKADHTV